MEGERLRCVTAVERRAWGSVMLQIVEQDRSRVQAGRKTGSARKMARAARRAPVRWHTPHVVCDDLVDQKYIAIRARCMPSRHGEQQL